MAIKKSVEDVFTVFSGRAATTETRPSQDRRDPVRGGTGVWIASGGSGHHAYEPWYKILGVPVAAEAAAARQRVTQQQAAQVRRWPTQCCC